MDNQYKMHNNLPYKAWLDGLPEKRLENKKKVYEFNNLPPEKWNLIPNLIKNMFASCGENPWIEAPFHCDYGKNIDIGDNFYANYNLIILDVGKVKIGDNVLIAPNVAIYTAGHPLHHIPRNSGLEYGIDITIGNNVWIGGNSVILPGVTIGNNSVIGAGSIVSKNIPENVLASGNPCKIIREITAEDMDYYFKDRKFSADDKFF